MVQELCTMSLDAYHQRYDWDLFALHEIRATLLVLDSLFSDVLFSLNKYKKQFRCLIQVSFANSD